MPDEIPADDLSGAVGNPVGPLHLLKMAVGIADIDELRRVRAARTKEHGGSWVYTRNHPRRAAAVLAGGSIYWVIRGQIRVRQRITGLHGEKDEKGRGYCRIEVDPELVATLWRPWRPFQGWRYLSPADVPPDAPGGWQMPDAAAGAMPEPLIAELRALGLW
jgi:hypothetical protein